MFAVDVSWERESLLVISDQGQGFDPHAISDPLALTNLEAEHERGIHLMKLAMDEVSFEERGAHVHMCKRPARYAIRNARSDSRSS
jgi:anti-sigma regulatory factor (Ser/Thr protein kinase)